MAEWNDPQTTRSPFGSAPKYTGPVAGGATVDAGLRSYMLSIYNYMASGVLLSGVVALLFARSGMAEAVFGSGLRWVVALAPLGFVMAMSFGLQKMSTGTLKLLFWGFSIAMGLSLSAIFFVYTGPSIALTFFSTAAAFAGLSLYGYSTKRNLSAMGAFMAMGVIGIIVAMVLNLFLQSGGLSLAISILGVLIFAGLTAYDTQRLRSQYDAVRGTDMVQKVVIMGALSLYLDFVNMFQFLLSLMGSRR